jgi:T5SS/PEP-CTERM-associated repeat protein
MEGQGMRRLVTLSIIVFLAGATLSWGYSLEGQTSTNIDAVSWNVLPDDLYAGYSTFGNSIVITNGGSVVNDEGCIGYDSSATSNMVWVTGSGSVWSNKSSLSVGFFGGANTLSITGGGRVENLNGYIGRNGPSTGNAVSVTGGDSAWNCAGELRIGLLGNGNILSITGGGRVHAADGIFLGNSSGNAVTVSGAGSACTNNSFLYIGTGSGTDNRLTVTNGGSVKNTTAYIGYSSGCDSNRLTVTGAQSVWNNTKTIYIGYKGSNNELSILDGGLVLNANGYIGKGNTSSNTVIVSGAGSVWTNSGSIYAGDNGGGNRLIITNGGHVYCNSGEISGSGTTAVVSGPDSVWNNSAAVYAGRSGSGCELRISNAGLVQSAQGLIGAQAGASNNTVIVSGSGSVWSNSGALYVGGSATEAGGTGSRLSLTQGGRVSAASAVLYPGATVSLDPETLIELSGPLSMQTGAVVSLIIDDDTAAGYGRLAADGAASLSGTLEVVITNNFVPQAGDRFDLFDWNGGCSGSFSALSAPELPLELAWNTSFLYTDGILLISEITQDGNTNGLPDVWELEFFDGETSPELNPDLDGYDNLAEYIAGSDPTDSNSYFRITQSAQDTNGFVIGWEPSVSGRVYSVIWTNNLDGSFTSIVDNIEFPQTSYTDTVHQAESSGFYQINVRMQ